MMISSSVVLMHFALFIILPSVLQFMQRMLQIAAGKVWPVSGEV